MDKEIKTEKNNKYMYVAVTKKRKAIENKRERKKKVIGNKKNCGRFEK